MNTAVGAFDAKATLSKLLQEVQRGHRFTITLRGLPVADLIPVEDAHHHSALAAVEAMRTVRKIQGVSETMLSDWVTEGRR